jgi:hypothetical protein
MSSKGVEKRISRAGRVIAESAIACAAIVFVLVSVGILVSQMASAPTVQAGACQNQPPCNCDPSPMGSPYIGPGGGLCEPKCNGSGGCSCWAGGWFGDCGSGGGPPPPPPCVPSCVGKVCGQDNGCGTPCSGPTAGDGICCPQEQIGKAGYKCQDCSTCGNLKNDVLGAGCFCDNVACPVAGRP